MTDRSDTPREQLTLELRRSPQPIPDAALAWFATFLRSDEARQIITATMRAKGWVCDGVHEPTTARGECGTCDETHDWTAREVSARLADKVEGK